MLNWFIGSIQIERIHPLECGFVRRNSAATGGAEWPSSRPLRFYPSHLAATV